MRIYKDVELEDLPFSDTEKEAASFAHRRLASAATEGTRERLTELSKSIPTRKTSDDEKAALLDENEPTDGENRRPPLESQETETTDDLEIDAAYIGMPRVEMYKIGDVLCQINNDRISTDSDLNNWLKSLVEFKNKFAYFVIATADAIEKLQEIRVSFPNFSMVTQSIVGAATLSLLAQTPMRFPKLLLNGTPGIGKTEYVRAICAALKLPLIVVPLGSIDGRFELVGGHRTYRSAEPGLLCKAYLNNHIANAVFLFDEAELGKKDLYQPLYSFIEDEYFQDHYLEVEFLVEHVNIILISNDCTQLPDAVRSRVCEIEIHEPTEDQKLKIIDRIYLKLRESRVEYALFSEELDSECKSQLMSLSLRQVRICLEKAMLMSADLSTGMGLMRVKAEYLVAKRQERNPIGFVH